MTEKAADPLSWVYRRLRASWGNTACFRSRGTDVDQLRAQRLIWLQLPVVWAMG